MPPRLRVTRAGPGVTVQDRGRHGYLRYGVNECGPMDWLAHETANRALENPGDAASLEIATGGVEVVCDDAPVRVAYAGGGFAWSHNGVRRPPAAVLQLRPGDRLAAGAGAWGAWTYLAVEGGIDVPRVLGSRSTHTRSEMGG